LNTGACTKSWLAENTNEKKKQRHHGRGRDRRPMPAHTPPLPWATTSHSENSPVLAWC
jgi:hypothetical protein